MLKFGEMRRLMSPPVNICSCVRAALDSTEGCWIDEDSDKDAICSGLLNLLKEKSEMLDEYFKIGIDKDGFLTSLPDLLNGFKPNPEELPIFLLRLATEVDWEEEKSCFEGIAKEIAEYYSKVPFSSPAPPSGEDSAISIGGGSSGASLRTRVSADFEFTVSSIFFPAFRAYLIPPSEPAENQTVNIRQLTTLETLFKVFERC